MRVKRCSLLFLNGSHALLPLNLESIEQTSTNIVLTWIDSNIESENFDIYRDDLKITQISGSSWNLLIQT